MNMAPRTDHGLARLAAQTLDRVRDPQTSTVSDQVITRLKGLPALLRTSGPLATLAFFAAKAGDAKAGDDKAGDDKPLARAYAVVGAALQEQVAAEIGEQVPASSCFSEFVLAFTGDTVPPGALSRASARLEEFALWLRRLAEATEQEQDRSQRQAGGRPQAGADA
jgi:CRISPR/Cas system CMR-associated protein Cmr5 small subunit